MLKYLLSIFILLFTSLSYSQVAPTPKFASKVQKAILSLNTYDKNGDLLHSGTAFYVGQDGLAIADYALFKDAYKAAVIDASGKQAEVDCIMGADDTYGIVKFKANTTKNPFLKISSTPEGEGRKLFAIPYTQKKLGVCGASTVESTSPVADKYSYYNLSPAMEETYTGTPLFNEVGELVAITQSPMKAKSYALDIRYMDTLKISAFMPKAQTQALAAINISKGIPETVEEALVYTYFKSRTAGNAEYLEIMNRFVRAFPDNAEGYQRRSVVLADVERLDEADADLQKYIDLSQDKQTAHYNAAQSILRKNQFQKNVKYEKWSYDYALSLIEDNHTLLGQLLRAQIYSAMKNHDKAVETYNEVLAVDSLRQPTIYYALSLALEARGDSAKDVIVPVDSAIAMFGTPLPGGAADYVLRHGQLLNKMGKYRLAVQDYNQYCYLVNNKVSAVFYYDRSQIELNGRMYQQAYDDITSAVSMEPRVPLYRIEHAAICLRIGELDDCISSCKAAIALNDTLYDPLRIMGYAYLQKGDKDSARKYLQQAVDLGDEAAKEIMEQYLK